MVLLAELKELSWDIVLFSEARALDCAVVLGDGHKLFVNSRGNIHAGVGILVEKKLVRRIRQVKRVNEYFGYRFEIREDECQVFDNMSI